MLVSLPMAEESAKIGQGTGEAEIGVEPESGDALALAAELVEEEDPETKMRRQVDAETQELRRQIEQQQEQINQMGNSDNSGDRKFWNFKVLLLAVVLIAGGASGAVFGLGGSESPPTEPLAPIVNETEGPTLDLTTAPPTETNETANPTDSPTIELKYDPPSPDECVDIANGNFTEEEDPSVVVRNFELPM
mmetsp:Transcript_42219/g.102013  ORF Transcript_42219/g.102013 Transcript_42219/m.102013 type:complete len:192 (-) Transcript_42219:2606-3181(-)